MGSLLAVVRTRIVPALLTALGVMLLTAGLLTYADSSFTEPTATEPPVVETLAPTAPPTPTPPPSASASPSVVPSPSASATPALGVRVATRVVVPALKIDLPVIKGPSGYPPCDVAMYLKELGQPGEPRATYIYAHARTGMFLPILDASKVRNGRAMLGMLVQVYTDDDRLYLYEITEVRRHQLDLDDALAATSDELWLQTSEGPRGTPGKTQVIAKPLSVGPADPAEAHPKPRPRACG